VNGFLGAPSPRWFTIPPHRPFAEDLARGLLAALGDGPEALADAVLLTPTRRAGREVSNAFLAVSPAMAALLPVVRPIGDLDDGEPPFEPADVALGLPPAISPWRRRFELARLVKAHEVELKRDLDAAGALQLADALGAFLDSCHIEERTEPGPIDELVDADFAEHWRVSAAFLKVALVQWPARLKELGLIDVAERRVRLLRRLGETWAERPPPGVLVAAGSTGTAPATAALLKAIAAAPQGCVVLPGLDTDVADDAWGAVDEQHPQASMKRLLDLASVSRADVRTWPASGEPASRARWRRRLIAEALRPADVTDDWLGQISALRDEAVSEAVDPVAEGLEGLSVLTARTEDEAAAAAAILIRETLEVPAATVAVVTPDLALARRISARLSRWGIEADTSAGTPLSGYPVAVLARLAARAARDPADPVALLGIMKSPLARLSLSKWERDIGARELERLALRGARPRDPAEIERKLVENGGQRDLAHPRKVLASLEAALSPLRTALAGSGRVAPGVAARALVETMEALARDERGRLGALWAGPAGDCASRLLAGLMEEGEALPAVDPRGFEALLEALLDGETVRMGVPAFPRVRILGAIEARLIRADRLILAGLEETTWPAGAPVDPFLSRPMRDKLGLPPPERRIGLAAHDFAQGAGAPQAVLLHAERKNGAPAVASRWLWRLQTLVQGAGLRLPGRPDVLAWARALDAPLENPPECLRPAVQPAPRPPLAERPVELAVTRIETLVRDPYAIYAQYVLNLKPLDRPDEPVEARMRGTAIHKALETFAMNWSLERSTGAAFAELYLAELTRAGMPQSALAREGPLAARAGEWVAAFEHTSRAFGGQVLLEAKGRYTFEDLGFTLTAKADRIERRGGLASVIDFKTGSAPSLRAIKAGFSPQLTLTALILANGGFEGVPATPPGELAYVRLTGREPAGERIVRAGEGTSDSPDSLMRQAEEGLRQLVERYQDPETPYRSRTAPEWAKGPGEAYDHLARYREWSTAEEEDI
jgi:ATP-dependent helicase/nuclease subunit B